MERLLSCHCYSQLTLQALCLHTEAILTGDLKAQMWASPFWKLVLFILWGWRLFLRAGGFTWSQ